MRLPFLAAHMAQTGFVARHAVGLARLGRGWRWLHRVNKRTCAVEETWFLLGYETALADLSAYHGRNITLPLDDTPPGALSSPVSL